LKQRIISLFLTACLWLSPLIATGTVVLYMDLREMAEVSDVVVHAKVLASEVRTDFDGPITTRTTIEAVHIMKGREAFKDGELWFDLLGGAKDGMQIRVPGTPTFRVGEEVILFLEKNSTDYAVCGLQQGVFRVRTEGPEKVVSRDLSGAAYAQFGGGGQYSMMHDAPQGVQAYPMANLLKELNLYLSEGRTEVMP